MGLIRFRLAPRTYDAWGARVVSLTKSTMKYPPGTHPENITTLLRGQALAMRKEVLPGDHPLIAKSINSMAVTCV